MKKKTIHDQRYIELIARIRACRKKCGISQVELAGKLGRSQSFIAKVESCERRIDLIETLEICAALDITLRDIMPNEFRKLINQKN